MAGLALALELLEASGRIAVASPSSYKVIHSATLLSAVSAAGYAAASSFSLFPPALQQSLRDWNIAYCEDKQDDWYERWLPTDTKYLQKTYVIELKPLFSAFQPKAFATTTLRSLLLNFAPLVEAYMQEVDEESDDNSDTDRPPSAQLHPLAALKRSGQHTIREVSVITVRRVLERIAVHYVSARTAWKLLKDSPKSAVRKAQRHITSTQLFAGVTKTTFRAHALGVAASWLVTETLDIYKSGRLLYLCRKDIGRTKEGCKKEIVILKSFGRKATGNTLKAVASLTFASIGAGCGAVLIKPSPGTWIGLIAGEFAGTYLVGLYLDTWMYK